MSRVHRVIVPLLIGLVTGLACWIAREAPPAPNQAPAPGSGRLGESAAVSAAFAERAAGERAARDERRVAPEADGTLLLPEAAELAQTLNSADFSPAEELEVLHSLVSLFRQANGGANPRGGLNEEIVDALRGRNVRRVAVLPSTLRRINEQGQLLDRWGTPYYFHPVSSRKLQIRSAGPDRRLWTDDDIQDEPFAPSVLAQE